MADRASTANGRYASGVEARRAAREGRLARQTSSIAPGHVQGNLVVLPEALAGDFLRFCQRNPKPCPILGVTEPGDPSLPALGAGIDLRVDLPRYRVWRDGELVDEPSDIGAHWRSDLVGFVIGCSFSFEEALVADGLEVRNIAEGVNVSMFRTSIPCAPAGVFAGPMVVTMRPFRPTEAIRAIQITSRFPTVHGAPVHIGLPEMIGIADLSKPDYGDAVAVREDELPVFWACGVTPQAVIAAARPAFAITHAPGAMLVTDLLNSRLAV